MRVRVAKSRAARRRRPPAAVLVLSLALACFLPASLLPTLPAQASPAGLPARAGRVEFVVGLGQYRADGEMLAMDAASFVERGRTFVPLRYLGNALGADVRWDGKAKKVTLTRGATRAELTVDKKAVVLDGVERAIDVAPLLRGGRVYLPARFVGDAFGYDSAWDAAAGMVTLTFRYGCTAGWLGPDNVWVFGRPPVAYLQTVGATATTWSVFWCGRNPDDETYLDRVHANGYRVASNLSTMQGTPNMTGDDALVRQAACRNVAGEPVELGIGVPILLACHNNPEWRQLLKRRVAEHVAGGADVITIDETAGNAGRLDAVCFCPYCLEGFRANLGAAYSASDLASRFGVSDLPAFDYRTYLAAADASCAASDPNEALRREFFRFQYGSRLEQLTELVAFARTQAGRPLYFAANLYGPTPVHHLFAGLCDVGFAERRAAAFPDDKRLGTYLLAQAMLEGRPFVGFPDVAALGALSSEDGHLWRHWLAEAVVCGASFLLPYEAFTYGGGSYTLPAEAIAPYTAFIREHASLYPGCGGGEVKPIAPVGLLYDLGVALYDWDDPVAENFDALGLALVEDHLPFGVVYAGDGDLVDRPLRTEDLDPYAVVVVPRGYGLRPPRRRCWTSMRHGAGGSCARRRRCPIPRPLWPPGSGP